MPAPGQGILTTARECRGAKPSQLLDIKYRRRQLDFQVAQTMVRVCRGSVWPFYFISMHWL